MRGPWWIVAKPATIKVHTDGTYEKHELRITIAALTHRLTEGVDYESRYAATPLWTSTRLLLAIANFHQCYDHGGVFDYLHGVELLQVLNCLIDLFPLTGAQGVVHVDGTHKHHLF